MGGGGGIKYIYIYIYIEKHNQLVNSNLRSLAGTEQETDLILQFSHQKQRSDVQM